MKKKYYKDKQLYLEVKWNDFVDTFENEEVFTNHVGTMCMPSATHDQSIVACEDVWIELDWSLFSMNCRWMGNRARGVIVFPSRVALELAELGNCRLGQVWEVLIQPKDSLSDQVEM